MSIIITRLATLLTLMAVLVGCGPQTDYTLLRQVRPTSILVIPPDNRSPELLGTYMFVSTISKPLSEKGYYVYPVGVVDAYFKANGVETADEMNRVPLEKLKEQFSPDAVLYTRIDYFGQKYAIIQSYGLIEGEMKLVDPDSGKTLWQHTLHFNENQNKQSGSSGMSSMIEAFVGQIVASLDDDRFFDFSAHAINVAVNSRNAGLPNRSALNTP